MGSHHRDYRRVRGPVPTTTTGRAVAVLLMLGGIALLGIVTASLASWLLDRIREVEQETQAATRQDIHLLMQRIDQLQAEVASLRLSRRQAGDPAGGS